MRTALLFVAALLGATPALAAPQSYEIDTSHSQVLFSFNHHGFAPITGLITGITGTISFDADAPETSTVTATVPLAKLTTGHEAQDSDILSEDFLGAEAAPEVSFQSTSIKVTGVDRALITGELTINGVTKEVVLDTVLNKQAKSARGTPTLGLSATALLLRSDFNAGRSAPANSDGVEVRLAIEAKQVAE